MKTYAILILTCVIMIALGGESASSRRPDTEELTALEQRLVEAINAQNADAVMANYARGDLLVVFDTVMPIQTVGWEAWRRNWEGAFALYPLYQAGVTELGLVADGDAGFGHALVRMSGKSKNGASFSAALRLTHGYRRIGGVWLIVHEHLSMPVDLPTGRAVPDAAAR